MIKALLLIFDPRAAWERVWLKKRTLQYILLAHVVPLLILTSMAEGYRLTHADRPGVIRPLHKYTPAEGVLFELGQLMLSIGVVFFGAKMLKALGETFHGRHTFTQAFSTVAYGLSPLFLLRFMDAFVGISPWVSFGVGISLSIATLYHGVWRVMEPDPPHAFGLYLTCAVLLVLTAGLARYVTTLYLIGKFPGVQSLVSAVAAKLHP